MAAGLVFAASFAVLLAASVSSAPPAVVQGAGEGWVWTVPPPPRNSSGETPNRWAARHLFHVGDVLDFKYWKGPVLVVRRRDYEWCGAASPAFRFADGRGNATTTMFILGLTGRRGFFYFITAARPRCEAGQRMAVRVASRYPSAISSAPAPAPVDDAPDQSVPSDQPWKKVGYAVLGFLAGGVFTFCVVFVFIRCCGNH